jgi:hypothetical protein
MLLLFNTLIICGTQNFIKSKELQDLHTIDRFQSQVIWKAILLWKSFQAACKANLI